MATSASTNLKMTTLILCNSNDVNAKILPLMDDIFLSQNYSVSIMGKEAQMYGDAMPSHLTKHFEDTPEEFSFGQCLAKFIPMLKTATPDKRYMITNINYIVSIKQNFDSYKHINLDKCFIAIDVIEDKKFCEFVYNSSLQRVLVKKTKTLLKNKNFNYSKEKILISNVKNILFAYKIAFQKNPNFSYEEFIKAMILIGLQVTGVKVPGINVNKTIDDYKREPPIDIPHIIKLFKPELLPKHEKPTLESLRLPDIVIDIADMMDRLIRRGFGPERIAIAVPFGQKLSGHSFPTGNPSQLWDMLFNLFRRHPEFIILISGNHPIDKKKYLNDHNIVFLEDFVKNGVSLLELTEASFKQAKLVVSLKNEIVVKFAEHIKKLVYWGTDIQSMIPDTPNHLCKIIDDPPLMLNGAEIYKHIREALN